jgi:hypothetical protein
VDYRFEVVRLPVSDVGKAKDCYQGLPSRGQVLQAAERERR